MTWRTRNELSTGQTLELKLELELRAACLARRALCSDASLRMRFRGQPLAECSNAARLAAFARVASRSNSIHTYVYRAGDAEPSPTSRVESSRFDSDGAIHSISSRCVMPAARLPLACAPRALDSAHDALAVRSASRADFNLTQPSRRKADLAQFWQPIAQT